MDKNAAKELLSFHSSRNSDVDNPKWQNGFLGSNHLLTTEQTTLLLAWVDIIETCFMFLLDDDPDDAFADYEYYLNGNYF